VQGEKSSLRKAESSRNYARKDQASEKNEKNEKNEKIKQLKKQALPP
jgi:hypothetical protein